MGEAKSHPDIGMLTSLPCPRCGHPLYEHAGLVWCSHVVTSNRSGGCDYGVSRDVTLVEYQALTRKPRQPLPQEAGFYIFDGFRKSARGRIVTIYNLVEVRREIVGNEMMFLVYHIHGQVAFPLAMYEGAWKKVVIPFEKKRV